MGTGSGFQKKENKKMNNVWCESCGLYVNSDYHVCFNSHGLTDISLMYRPRTLIDFWMGNPELDYLNWDDKLRLRFLVFLETRYPYLLKATLQEFKNRKGD